MSVVGTLYKSRRYNANLGMYEVHSDVATLVRHIEDACDKRGLFLYRWENHSYPYIRPNSPKVTYVVMRGERPGRACEVKDPDAIVVTFVGREGTTKQCRAYHQLDWLMHEVVGSYKYGSSN